MLKNVQFFFPFILSGRWLEFEINHNSMEAVELFFNRVKWFQIM